jgi:hypothetical protein
MRNILIFLIIGIFLINLASALTVSPNNIYLDVNVTYPLILAPLDNNVWNITLWVKDGNWTGVNFTWNGTRYNLNILFNDIKDYPFMINSTEVTGNINGTFLVRQSYNVTFRFLKWKQSYFIFSNRYINDMAYVTAEVVGNTGIDPNLEPFFAPLLDSRFRKPVFFARYINGEATLKLYDNTNYAIRLIDGEITFNNEYSIPNITKSYGTYSYIGKYNLNSTNSYTILLSTKDLRPFTWLINWIVLGLIICSLVVGVFLIFIVPENTSLAFVIIFALPIVLIILRAISYLGFGF